MTDLPIYFAYPGDLATLSGGYHYDRRLIGELRKSGVEVNTPVSYRHLTLPTNREV